MAAMTLYGEDLHRTVERVYHGAKPIHLIPVALAVGWIHFMIEHGQFPGLAKTDFYPRLFNDDVHLNPDGAYLVDCMFYSAFYGQSPEGKFLPLGTHWNPAQAKVLQRLSWETFKNYSESGFYAIGKRPVDHPAISTTAPRLVGEVMQVKLTSSTTGAWFRYTLDGTVPTHANGYIYCGVISVRQGMTVKAVAYKSGMADSSLAEAAF